MFSAGERAPSDEHPSPTAVLPRLGADPSGWQEPSARGRRTPRLRHWVIIVVVTAVAATSLVGGYLPWHLGSRTPQFQKVATLPYWNLATGSQSVAAHHDSFTGASPWVYGVDDRGAVVSQVPAESVGQMNQALARLTTAGVALMPTISNHWAGSWSRKRVARIIQDPVLRARHVQDVVDLVTKHDFAGVDIDYEELLATDRTAFSAFIRQLAVALHAKDKKLSVDVFAKATDKGYDQRNVAQDYAALGAAADQIRIMAYDWHWSSSTAGPIAPLNWDNQVLKYAVTQMPPQKIILGVPTYGYDWVGAKGQLVSWLQAYQLSRTHGAVVRWDNKAQSPWFTYESAQRQQHTVWFENAYSSSAKIALAKSFKLGGVYLWLVGDEDDLIWSRLGSGRSGNDSAPSAAAAGGGQR